MTYTVHLVDRSNRLHNNPPIPLAVKQEVENTLTRWFMMADKMRANALLVSCAWVAMPNASADIVIYFVARHQNSVLRSMPYFPMNVNLSTATGLTVLPPNNVLSGIHGSEVYLNRCQTPHWIAVTAFHEAMHNQLRAGNEMHMSPMNYGGGIAAAVVTVTNATTPNDANLQRYGGVMDIRHSQWLAG